MKRILCATIGLLIIGAGLFVSGLNPPLYRNQEEFESRYMLLGPGKSKEYRELRKLYLTEAIPYQNYGITMMIVGAMLPFFSVRAVAIRLPQKRVTLALLGSAAALVTICAELGSLFLDLSRGEFPWWADSLGIPVFGAPFVLLGLLCWVALHVRLLPKARRPGQSSADGRCAEVWLIVMGFFTTSYLVYAVCVGDFWSLLPTAMWWGFYRAILKGRRALRVAA